MTWLQKSVFRACIAVVLGFVILMSTKLAQDPRFATTNHGNMMMTRNISHFPRELIGCSKYHPDLVAEIKQHWLLSPSHKQLNVTKPLTRHFSEKQQSKMVDQILKERTNGFFVDCGAGDGERWSNSLFFEKYKNWTGLLVEADEGMFKGLWYKNRHAYLLNACLSPSFRAMVLPFTSAGDHSGLTDCMAKQQVNMISENNPEARHMYVPCFPLDSVLHAINVTHIDYLSLDVQGAELDILRSVSWDSVTVDVVTVDYDVWGCDLCSQNRYRDIIRFMATVGYHKFKLAGRRELLFYL